jgi:hypothetical protein
MTEQSRREALKLTAAAAGAAALGATFLHSPASAATESDDKNSFENIDKGIKSAQRKHRGAELSSRAKDALENAPASVKDTIYEYYKPIRPILVVISDLPLLPQGWRDALKAFIAVMDQICGSM